MAALNKDRRAGGQAVAVIQLVHAPYLEPLDQIRDEDYQAEGLAFLLASAGAAPQGFPADDCSWQSFEEWRRQGGSLWVVRFTLLEVL